MTEKIGNVLLDYQFYKGQDIYSDGDVEEKILDIVQNNNPEQFNEIIAKNKDWAVMYHLSHIRRNILGTVQINKTDKVLEIGSGCGAITGGLAAKAESVTCVELSKRRSMINANQNKQCDNVKIMVGNFQDIEPSLDSAFDVITLIGVFEYANLYIESEKPFEEFLMQISRHLAPDGQLVIAIENKFGLKYWAGCQEDHIGGYFSGIEGYKNEEDGIRTFSKKELEELFKITGFDDVEFYYPYPDYKFPMVIYSDEVLPKLGELNINLQNFDRERIVLFNETNVYDEIIKNEQFPFFANSYLVTLRKRGKVAGISKEESHE